MSAARIVEDGTGGFYIVRSSTVGIFPGPDLFLMRDGSWQSSHGSVRWYPEGAAYFRNRGAAERAAALAEA